MSKKIKYTVEYPVRCSPVILYEFLSTSSGLQEWFADKVEDENGVFTFSWSGAAEEAQVVDVRCWSLAQQRHKLRHRMAGPRHRAPSARVAMPAQRPPRRAARR